MLLAQLPNLIARRKKLLKIARDYENIVVRTPQNIFYLTNFWGSGVAIVKKDRTILITTPLEKDRARDTAMETEVIGAGNEAALWKAASRHLIRGESVVDSRTPFDHKMAESPALFLKARREKDDDEVARIKSASEKIDKIFVYLEGKLRAGMSERVMASEVMRFATVEGLTPLGGGASLNPIIVASGENGSYPHAEVTDRRVGEGEFVTIDIFFRFGGYCSDSTRTFAVRRVAPELRIAYNSVLEAQRAGIREVGPGVSCREVHQSVVGQLKRRDLAKYFIHGTGHGVGIDIHELPSVGRTSKDRLRMHDVITIEPGIYLKGRYGIRIEDTVLVREKAVVLTRYPKELIVAG
jgi:Xaa-Pro aminopeptidase/Xaa-Pro dipeptidase